MDSMAGNVPQGLTLRELTHDDLNEAWQLKCRVRNQTRDEGMELLFALRYRIRGLGCDLNEYTMEMIDQAAWGFVLEDSHRRMIGFAYMHRWHLNLAHPDEIASFELLQEFYPWMLRDLLVDPAYAGKGFEDLLLDGVVEEATRCDAGFYCLVHCANEPLQRTLNRPGKGRIIPRMKMVELEGFFSFLFRPPSRPWPPRKALMPRLASAGP